MSIERVERKSGYVWRVRWRDDQGQERSKVLGRRRDAEALEAEIVRSKRTGDLDLLTGGKETLAEFGQEWWRLYAVPNLGIRTQRSYAALWDRHLLPRLGGMSLRALTHEVIEGYRAELEAAGVGQPTVYRALALLQGVLQRAVEWRRIQHNPVKVVRKPKVRRQRAVRPLTPLVVEQLRTAAARRHTHGERDATLISLLAYAGLRPQEVLALRWGDVRERTLLIEKASDGQGGIKSTKTQNSRTCSAPKSARRRLGRVAAVVRAARRRHASVPKHPRRSLERPRLADVASRRLASSLSRSWPEGCAALRPPSQLRLAADPRGGETSSRSLARPGTRRP